MKRWQRMMAALLAMAMVCGALMAGASAAGTNSLPYEIKVNRKMNTVTVYTQDEAGNYTVPYKADDLLDRAAGTRNAAWKLQRDERQKGMVPDV